MSMGPLSTILDDDASRAYRRLRHEARTLASISHSFDAVSKHVAATYLDALTAASPAAWAAFVGSAAALVRTAHALDGSVAYDAAEREALDFFTAIMHENADLLALPAPQPGSASSDSRYASTV